MPTSSTGSLDGGGTPGNRTGHDDSNRPGTERHLKVIACEIAFREICYAVARTPSVVDLEFLTRATMTAGRGQGRNPTRAIWPFPAGQYDALLIGYGLCSSILDGLRRPPCRW